MLYTKFSQQVRNYPHKEVLVCGSASLTFSELDQRTDEIAQRLITQNVSSNSIVATALPAGIDFIATALAIYKIGACFLPLNIKFTDNELADYLSRSDTQILVADKQEIQRISRLGIALQFLDINADSVVETLSYHEPDKHAPGLILFSSGSTGKAKQVVRTYGQLVAEAESFTATALVDSADVFLCTVPLHHAHGFSNCFMASLLNGAKLVITPGEFNPRAVIKALDQHDVTVYPSATFMLKMLAATRVRQQPDLTHLRLVFSAGAPLAAEIQASLKAALNISACQLYGSTEAGAMALNIGDAPGNSVGLPLKGVTITVFNEDNIECPPDVEGELGVMSPAAAIEYKGMPDASAATFRDNVYFTGDIGYKNIHGDIFVTGRKKALINVAGLKVDPTEVEHVLLALNTVKDVVVLGKPDGDYGEMVKAVIVVSEGVTEGDVVAHCKANLAEYKWPKLIEFRNEIPRSPLGKILRKYL